MNSLIDYIARNSRYALPSNWRAGAKAIYRRLSKSGILFAADELGMASLHPSRKVARVIELVKPLTVVDVGCGTGSTLRQFVEAGIAAVGVEASRAAIRASEHPELIRRHDLRRPLDLGRRFDLVWCFEVAEHIHPSHVEAFVDNLCRHSDIITLSAAPPGQGGEGHFNEQPQSYWVSMFAKRGYYLHSDWTAQMHAVQEFYSENMMVFCKASAMATRLDG
jgi:2-polyprenyl-3-methyl-5-hydroxy-6-metoxy-1,4-benzoquinol methylase